MGQWGEAFGIPFAIEGLFFFTEAIFIAIYIYGWRRLKPWPHFWTGVPIVITGIGGTISVVAANAWMNEPAGFTLNSAGKIVDVDPWRRDLQQGDAATRRRTCSWPRTSSVGSSSRRSTPRGCCGAARDRYHRLGFIIPFTVAAIATPVQMVVGDTLARWVYENEPIKFAAIELVPKTESDVPETLFGHMNEDGTVTGGIPIPGLASILSDPADGTSTVVQGRNAFPEDEQPTIAQANTVHLAWDLMVGIGTLLFLLSVWYGAVLDLPARHAAVEVVPSHRRVRRRPLDHRHGGRLGRHRGRPAAVDRVRPHEGRGRGHDEQRRLGSRSSSSCCCTSRSRSPRSLVLRRMSRRFRETDEPDVTARRARTARVGPVRTRRPRR